MHYDICYPIIIKTIPIYVEQWVFILQFYECQLKYNYIVIKQCQCLVMLFAHCNIYVNKGPYIWWARITCKYSTFRRAVDCPALSNFNKCDALKVTSLHHNQSLNTCVKLRRPDDWDHWRSLNNLKMKCHRLIVIYTTILI